MIGSDRPIAPAFTVRAPDGAAVAVWPDGSGAPIVLVHGSLRAHAIFDPLVDQLRTSRATFAIDRRGFGASGDAPTYAIEREFDDVATVVDHVARLMGCRVTLFGHSYGAGCAMGAATRTSSLDRLVVYEPGLGIAYPPEWMAANERALAAGDREAVIQAVLRDVLEMPANEVQARQATPQWAEYLAAAETVVREARAENDWTFTPGRLSGISCPTTVLLGTETAPALMRSTLLAAAAIPNARIRVLAGHGHLAYLTDPALIASHIMDA